MKCTIPVFILVFLLSGCFPPEHEEFSMHILLGQQKRTLPENIKELLYPIEGQGEGCSSKVYRSNEITFERMDIERNNTETWDIKPSGGQGMLGIEDLGKEDVKAILKDYSIPRLLTKEGLFPLSENIINKRKNSLSNYTAIFEINSSTDIEDIKKGIFDALCNDSGDKEIGIVYNEIQKRESFTEISEPSSIENDGIDVLVEKMNDGDGNTSSSSNEISRQQDEVDKNGGTSAFSIDMQQDEGKGNSSASKIDNQTDDKNTYQGDNNSTARSNNNEYAPQTQEREVISPKGNSEGLSDDEIKAFMKKTIGMVNRFTELVQRLTERNARLNEMSLEEMKKTPYFLMQRKKMRAIFGKEYRDKEVVGYTPDGIAGNAKKRTIDAYLDLLLNQRIKYDLVSYEYGAFFFKDLVEIGREKGKIKYKGQLCFEQKFQASKERDPTSELGYKYNIKPHIDKKCATFIIQKADNEDGEYWYVILKEISICNGNCTPL